MTLRAYHVLRCDHPKCHASVTAPSPAEAVKLAEGQRWTFGAEDRCPTHPPTTRRPLMPDLVPPAAVMRVRQHFINNGCTLPLDVVREGLEAAAPLIIAEHITAAADEQPDGIMPFKHDLTAEEVAEIRARYKEATDGPR